MSPRSDWQRLVGVSDEIIRESINGRIVSGQAAGAKPPRQLTPEERAAYEAEMLAREAKRPAPPPPVEPVPPERVRAALGRHTLPRPAPPDPIREWAERMAREVVWGRP